jgi:hypothetical protein
MRKQNPIRRHPASKIRDFSDTLLAAKSLRRILQVTEGLTALIFRMLNELAIEAVKTGVERITDDAVERWRPSIEIETAFL